MEKKIPGNLLYVNKCIRGRKSEVECFHWCLLRIFNVKRPPFWDFWSKVKIIAQSFRKEFERRESG